MVAYYTIAGRQIGSHYLAMGVLGSVFGATFLSVGGSKAKAATSTPPINASSPDEESYIKDFLAQADGGKKDEKAPAAH